MINNKQVYNKEFDWPLPLIPGRSLCVPNDESVFVIPGGPLNHNLSFC